MKLIQKWLDVDEAPNKDELDAGVDESPKPRLPKARVLGANGFEDVEEEKGLTDDWSNAGEATKGLDYVLDAPKPTPLVD